MNRLLPDLSKLFAGGDRRWVRVEELSMLDGDASGFSEAEQAYVASHNRSELQVMSEVGLPADPLEAVAVTANGGDQPEAMVLAVARSRAQDIERALSSGETVWLSTGRREVPQGFEAVAIDREEQSVTFLGWCSQRIWAGVLDEFVTYVRSGESGLPLDLGPGELVEELFSRDSPTSVAYGRFLALPDALPWAEQPADERSMQDAPTEVLDTMRTVSLVVLGERSIANGQDWLVCAGHDIARTGCMSGGLIGPEPVLMPTLFPEEETVELRVWLVEDAREVQTSYDRRPLGRIQVSPSTAGIILRFDLDDMDQISVSEAENRSLIELVALTE